MSRIRGKHSKPELVVRRMAHEMGLRFRLHRKDLPGTPDLVFPGRKIVAFVHGCFWHRHPGCRRASGTRTRWDYWQSKFERNVARDREAKARLEASGWRVVTFWECETRHPDIIAGRLQEIARSPVQRPR
jgi:DNA mismatch endonuclease (patch repair protein)